MEEEPEGDEMAGRSRRSASPTARHNFEPCLD